MEELYKVPAPREIVFGDPLYFDEMSDEDIERLTVNFVRKNKWSGRVKLQEINENGFVYYRMIIYMAPSRTIETYAEDMMFTDQKAVTKDIGVDTARYYLRIDSRDDEIHTGGDGYWGTYTEYQKKDTGKIDAVVVEILVPECESMEDFRRFFKYYFPVNELVQ